MYQITLLTALRNDIYSQQEMQSILLERCFRSETSEQLQIYGQKQIKTFNEISSHSLEGTFIVLSKNLLVVFNEGIVKVISSHLYSETVIGNVRYGFAPHTVQKLILERRGQSYPLQTRLFPCQAIQISFRENNIYGSIDLTCLPRDLVDFDVRFNLITGMIDLQRLPRSLRTLLLGNNQVKQSVVLYDNLPSELECIDLTGLEIGELKGRNQSQGFWHRPTRYFQGISPDKVH